MNEVDFIIKMQTIDSRLNIIVNKLDQTYGVSYEKHPEPGDTRDHGANLKIRLKSLLFQLEHQIQKELRLTKLQVKYDRSVFLKLIDYGKNTRQLGLDRFEFQHLTYLQLEDLKKTFMEGYPKIDNNGSSVYIFPDILDSKGVLDLEKEQSFHSLTGDASHRYLMDQLGKVISYNEKGDDILISGIFQKIQLNMHRSKPA